MKAAGFLPLLILGIVSGLQPQAAGVEAVLRHDVSISSKPSIRAGKWDAPVLPISESDTVYIQFDVNSVLPAETTAGQVAKASLRLWVSKVSTPGLCGVYPVTSPWIERMPIGYGGSLPGLPTLGSRAVLVPHYLSKAFLVADVTSLVRGWLSGIPNYGLAVRGDFLGLIVHGPGSELIVDGPIPELRVPLVARVDSKENTASGHEATLQIVLTGSNP
jgi:hypothetical protein